MVISMILSQEGEKIVGSSDTHDDPFRTGELAAPRTCYPRTKTKRFTKAHCGY